MTEKLDSGEAREGEIQSVSPQPHEQPVLTRPREDRSSLGAASRARRMRGMQQQAGNERIDQRVAENEQPAHPGPLIQRQPNNPRQAPAAPARRVDVVVIVGRPSLTIQSREDEKEKLQMETWRAAAYALSPHVYEGLTVDRAFANLRRLNQPIGKLYIIGHADESGVGEVNAQGNAVSTTVEDLTRRMNRAAGSLGANKPESVEMLSCYGGGMPKMMGRSAARWAQNECARRCR
jgi:hypothetical protein